MKRFNVTGICRSDKHYMCDVTEKFNRCKYLCEEGYYYAINFPRQYGKSTMRVLLKQFFLEDEKYLVLTASFEGVGDTLFESEAQCTSGLLEIFAKNLRLTNPSLAKLFIEKSKSISRFYELSVFLTDWIISVKKYVILIVDEVDKASNNQLFLDFLGMLRDKYLSRIEDEDVTFHSVVLIGVHDVKSLKLKIRPDEERKMNSPWNISKDLDTDFAFSVDEIVPMVQDYADEHSVKMDCKKLAQRLYYYTSGRPFLTSLLCEYIDEKILKTNVRPWKVSDINRAYHAVINEQYTTTNFDDLTKNLENNPDLYDLVYSIVIQGERFSFTVSNPVINLGKTYGILAQNSDGHCDVSNKVYEFRIVDYMLSKERTKEIQMNIYASHKFKENGELNIPLILKQFQLFMQEHHSSKDNTFLEKNGRLLLMSFLRPIINGRGYMFKENVTAEDRKMDLVVTFNDKRYVIELKIWYGKKYLEDGYEQLCDYLDQYKLNEGAMLIYNFNKKKEYKIVIEEHRGKTITAVFV